MHLLIAFITALASLLYALDRLGVDIGWLNPWTWKRRRRWLKQYHANPAFALDSPMEVVALLATATAKIDGDVSSEEKTELRRLFETIFHQSETDSSALIRSSTFLLSDGEAVYNKPEEVLSRSLEKFSAEQKASSIELLSKISHVGGPPSEAQVDFILRIEKALTPNQQSSEWK